MELVNTKVLQKQQVQCNYSWLLFHAAYTPMLYTTWMWSVCALLVMHMLAQVRINRRLFSYVATVLQWCSFSIPVLECQRMRCWNLSVNSHMASSNQKCTVVPGTMPSLRTSSSVFDLISTILKKSTVPFADLHWIPTVLSQLFPIICPTVKSNSSTSITWTTYSLLFLNSYIYFPARFISV